MASFPADVACPHGLQAQDDKRSAIRADYFGGASRVCLCRQHADRRHDRRGHPGDDRQSRSGFRGLSVVGYNRCDALLLWDLSKSDKPSEPKPGLATSYEIDPNDHKHWIVHLREGITWHAGCKFTADDVIWNFQMRIDQSAPNFSPQQFTYTRAFLSNVKSVSKIDDYTIAIENNFLKSLFPYTLTYVLMISPCRAKEVNYDWAQYALHPSGTGPYKFDRLVPHERLELVANTAYWDKARVPRQDRLVLIPMPEASTRTAALLTGQVDWIEAPSPMLSRVSNPRE